MRQQHIKLKSLLTSVVSGNPPQRSVNEFIFLCRKIALVHLRSKMNKGHFTPDFFSATLDDLALDTIADLFSTDEQGNLIQVKTFFESLPLDETTEENLLAHTRRLVCSRVNQRLFRMYQEVDPSLGKILRNVKLSLELLHNFITIERFGEQCIVPSMCDTLEHLPNIERDELERELRYHVNGSEPIPTMLAKLSQFLREQTAMCRILPLMDAAIVFRSIYLQSVIKQEEFHLDETLIKADVNAIIKNICQQQKSELCGKYVGKKKLSPEMFQNYFDVIEKTIALHIVGRDGDESSLFESLKEYMPQLTREEYHSSHKSKLEYLARMTHRKVIGELKKNF